ncbi:MAG: hypothetical protein GX913_08495 [Clostridiales bacterium]|nr:hypothetical protein [Clostridiales bacterium]
MNEGIKLVFDKVWELFNLGIPIGGFYLKFWYLPAFFILIDLAFRLFGFSMITLNSGAREKPGSSAKYRSKKGGNVDEFS